MKDMNIPFRPFAAVKMILEEAGTDVSYAYDDLVFADHTAYLIQFDDQLANNLKIYFNTEMDPVYTKREIEKLRPLFEKYKMSYTLAGKFSVSQKEHADEEIQICFYDG